jgi:ankyrin repeat protein
MNNESTNIRTFIELLIDAGADVNEQDDSGMSALFHAANSNYDSEATKASLLQFGADPNIVDTNGKKAIDYAKDNINLRNTKSHEILAEVTR